MLVISNFLHHILERYSFTRFQKLGGLFNLHSLFEILLTDFGPHIIISFLIAMGSHIGCLDPRVVSSLIFIPFVKEDYV